MKTLSGISERTLTVVMALSFWMVLAVPVWAQQVGQPQAAQADKQDMRKSLTETVRPASSLSVQKVSGVVGQEVKNEQDQKVGFIKDLAIDPQSGRVSFALLSIGGFIGFGDKVVAVPWTALEQKGEGVYALDADTKELEEAPDFEKTGRYMSLTKLKK